MTFPRLVGALGIIGGFGFYAGLNVCAFKLVMIFFFLPGTHISFIYYIVVVVFLQFFFIICYRNETTNSRRTRLRFRCPSITTCSYQAKTFLPYWIKRYIFFQNVELEPLYNFDEAESVTIDFL